MLQEYNHRAFYLYYVHKLILNDTNIDEIERKFLDHIHLFFADCIISS